MVLFVYELSPLEKISFVLWLGNIFGLLIQINQINWKTRRLPKEQEIQVWKVTLDIKI